MADDIRWTRELPSVPGWYWYRADAREVTRLTDVQRDRFGAIAGLLVYSPWHTGPWPVLIAEGGEWAGPILPPPESP